MSSTADVRFRNVTKCYPMKRLSAGGFKDLLLHLPRRLMDRARSGSYCALDDVSFEVAPGECFGIIGRNGAGKSTTLGLIAGVLEATRGTVEVARKVAPLLDLGAGFHPELSGRENIVLNGVLLGLTRRQILDRMADIEAFSELGEFLEQPIRTYSSGMIARLGFSVVAHLDPEILLIDEVLAVGDESFQQKCLARMQAFRARGATMILVSHSLEMVERICDRVALVSNGRLMDVGEPARVVPGYRALAGVGWEPPRA